MTDSPNRKPIAIKSHDVHLDGDYTRWIVGLKQRYRQAQIRASVKVNSEQLLFDWSLGRDLAVLRVEECWGKGVVEQVSLDLKEEFPNAKGFSARNLWYMKRWYLFYAEDGDLEEKLARLNSTIELGSTKLRQVAAETPFPSAFGFVPWWHHVEIITKCKTVDETLFYVEKTINEGLSRSALVDVIKADLYHSMGNAPTNYPQRLPEAQGKLAQQIIKDTYDLGFVTLPPGYDETALENALERDITRFLLELGTGFAFVGRQFEIVVSGKTRRADMLFYHIRLRCYVVVELKVALFEPEFAGKLNFYINAVNKLEEFRLNAEASRNS